MRWCGDNQERSRQAQGGTPVNTYTYATTDRDEQPITGIYKIWPDGNYRAIEYTYPDGDTARWTAILTKGTYPYQWYDGNGIDRRTKMHDAIVDAIRKSEGLAPSIVHPTA